MTGTDNKASSPRSAESYEAEIARLERALSDECANSLRLSQQLVEAAVAWFHFDQQALDEQLPSSLVPDDRSRPEGDA